MKMGTFICLMAVLFISGCVTNPPYNLSQIGPYVDPVPSPDSGFQLIGTAYFRAFNPTEVNGKLAYEAKESESDNRFIIYDGKEFGKDYDGAYYPLGFDGKLGYIAAKTIGYEKHFIEILDEEWETPINEEFIILDGKKVSENYDHILSDTITYNDKVLYFIGIRDNSTYIVEDFVEHLLDFECADTLNILDGSLVYRAGMNCSYKYFFGECSCQEYYLINGNLTKGPYTRIGEPVIIGEKVAFDVKTPEPDFIIFGDEKIEGERFAYYPANVNGKLAYFMDDIIYLDKEQVSDDYTELGGTYGHSIQFLGEVNGRLTYDIEYGAYNPRSFIMYGEEKTGDGYAIGEYIRVSFPTGSGISLAFVAEKIIGSDGKYAITKKLINYGGKEIGSMYENIDGHSLNWIDGKLVYVASMGKDIAKVSTSKWFIVIENNQY